MLCLPDSLIGPANNGRSESISTFLFDDNGSRMISHLQAAVIVHSSTESVSSIQELNCHRTKTGENSSLNLQAQSPGIHLRLSLPFLSRWMDDVPRICLRSLDTNLHSALSTLDGSKSQMVEAIPPLSPSGTKMSFLLLKMNLIRVSRHQFKNIKLRLT